MKTGDSKIDERKLIGNIARREDWGNCHGFWATTYEFQPVFFEMDFLPNLLNLGSWDDHHWTTRITLERELALMDTASIMLDAGCYNERPQSLRVEILPTKGRNGNKLHAKVLLCLYEKALHLIVGSANLTDPGYRKNIEVAAVLTVTPKNVGHAGLISEALTNAGDILGPWWSEAANGLNQKAIEWLKKVSTTNSSTRDWFAWGGGKTPLWQQFLSRWPQDEQIRKITIVSPFWSDEDGKGPVARFVKELQRRKALVKDAEVLLVTEATPEGQNSYLPSLPSTYGIFDFSGLGIQCYAQPVDPTVAKQEVLRDDLLVTRRLHAKVVLLEGQRSSLAYVGSANFTHKGWGFLTTPLTSNIEAGIIALKRGDGNNGVEQLIPTLTGTRIRLNGENEAPLGTYPNYQEGIPWPAFIKDIRLVPENKTSHILQFQITTRPVDKSGPWKIAFVDEEEEPKKLLDETEVPFTEHEFNRPLDKNQLERLLREREILISWWECPTGRRCPINVDAAARDNLPISPESRDPNERMLLAYYQGRILYEDLFPPPDGTGEKLPEPIDKNLSGVDTSKIQSYQIREFVESIEGIRQDLQEAADHSEKAMRLALLGPVSPVALSRIIVDGVTDKTVGRTPLAAGFQLTEILCLLKDASYLPGNDSWDEHLQKAIGGIQTLINQMITDYPDILGKQTRFEKYFDALLSHFS